MKNISYHVNLWSAPRSQFSSISWTIFKIQAEYFAKISNYAMQSFLSAVDVICIVMLMW